MADSEPQGPVRALVVAALLCSTLLACTGGDSTDDAAPGVGDDGGEPTEEVATTEAELIGELEAAVAEGGDVAATVAQVLVDQEFVTDSDTANCVATQTLDDLGGDGLVAAARSLDETFPLEADGSPTDPDTWSVVTATMTCSVDGLAGLLRNLGVEAAADCAAGLVDDPEVVVAWALYGYGLGSDFADDAGEVAVGLLDGAVPANAPPSTSTAALLAERLGTCLDDADRAAVTAPPPAG